MIDLTQKGLPNVVWINGSPFSIYTDYRLWMRFEIEVGKLKRGQVMDISYLFKNEMPEHCNISELFSFSRPYSPLPRNIGAESDVIALDYELDGDLIYLKNKKCKNKKSEKQEKIFSYEHFKDFDATKLSAWIILYMKDNAKNKFNPPFNFNNMTKEELSVWAKRLADNFDYKKYRSFK